MSQPYIGEIRLVGFAFEPVDWAYCDGRLLPIAEFTTLFALIGTTYGGDGQQTFALPDLRGRVPIHQGPGFFIGQEAGSENVTLTAGQVPQHTHRLVAAHVYATHANPAGLLPGRLDGTRAYGATVETSMASDSVAGGNGGGQPHENMQPYAVLNYVISLIGVFPSRN